MMLVFRRLMEKIIEKLLWKNILNGVPIKDTSINSGSLY